MTIATASRRPRRRSAAGFAALSLCLAAQPLPAATLVVDGLCSLHDAILAANTDQAVGACPAGSGDDLILLDVDVELGTADPHPEHSALHAHARAGLPDITAPLAIEARAGSIIRRDPNLGCTDADPTAFRLLTAVAGVGSLTLRGLTLANGCAAAADAGNPSSPNDYVGGGALLFLNGTLRLENVRFIGNTARSLDVAEGNGLQTQGGAVLALGFDTTVTGCSFGDNLALSGSALHEDGMSGNVQGGAMAVNSLVALLDSRFVGNRAESGPGGKNGGAVYGSALRAYTLSGPVARLQFLDNIARGGDAGSFGGTAHGTFALIGNGAMGMQDAQFAGNRVEGGSSPHQGGSGAGGGLYAENALGPIERVAFIDNLALGGSGGTGFGGWGIGGALVISAQQHPQEIRNASFAGNRAQGASGATDGLTQGGALFLDVADGARVSQASIVGNQLGGTQGAGTGLYATGPVQIDNSLLYGNVHELDAGAADCDGEAAVASLGYNRIGSAGPDCDIDAPGDALGIAGTAAWVERGCAQTLPDGGCIGVLVPEGEVEAIDSGSCALAGRHHDAHGSERPVTLGQAADDGCDIGAHELGLSILRDGFEA